MFVRKYDAKCSFPEGQTKIGNTKKYIKIGEERRREGRRGEKGRGNNYKIKEMSETHLSPP